MPHPKDRAEGWPPTMKIGRVGELSDTKIIQKANQIYDEYQEYLMKINGMKADFTPGSFPDVIRIYKRSPYYKDLAPRTQKDYDRLMAIIEDWSASKGHPNIKYMTRKSLLAFLSSFEDGSRTQKYAKAVLSILFSAAMREDYVSENIVTGIRLTRRKKVKKLVIWEEQDVKAFVDAAFELGHPSLARACVMAFETGQRKMDVLKMQQPRDYENGTVKFKQNKTGKLVNIPTTRRLRTMLDEIPRSQMILFPAEHDGQIWDEGYSSKVIRKIADHAGLGSHVFMDLRHSAILQLYRADISVAGIASITGHSLKTINAMLEEHYLESRDAQTAQNAIQKLEDFRSSQTNGQTPSQTKK